MHVPHFCINKAKAIAFHCVRSTKSW